VDKSQNKSGERGFRLLGMVTQISLTMPPRPACQNGRAGGEGGAVTRRRD